jgi:hypothetical protein
MYVRMYCSVLAPGCSKDLNTSQGLGFMVFSTVVDKKTLNKM